MIEKILYRLVIVTIYAGLVLAIFDPSSSSQPKAVVAATPPAKATPANQPHSTQRYLEHSIVAQSH